MMLVKCILNVWEDEIVSTLSELHGTRWPGFDGEEMVKAMLFSQAVVHIVQKLAITYQGRLTLPASIHFGPLVEE